MRVAKAVAIEPSHAAQIANGESFVSLFTTTTAFRGKIVIVVAGTEPLARATAELVDVQPVAENVQRSAKHGYLWRFDKVTPLTAFSIHPRGGDLGLFDVEISDAAAETLPPDLFGDDSAQDPVNVSRIALAGALRAANAGLQNVSGNLRELARVASSDADRAVSYDRLQAIVDSLCLGVDQLITEMIRNDIDWDEQLATGSELADKKHFPAFDDALVVRSGRLDVLLVDDEPKMARGLARSLATDHDVRVALSKQEAIEKMREKVPDILLCDYRIEWQSSEDLLQMVKDHYPTVRRILYSFSRVEIWCDLLRRNLIDAAIPKSASKTEILATLA